MARHRDQHSIIAASTCHSTHPSLTATTHGQLAITDPISPAYSHHSLPDTKLKIRAKDRHVKAKLITIATQISIQLTGRLLTHSHPTAHRLQTDPPAQTPQNTRQRHIIDRQS